MADTAGNNATTLATNPNADIQFATLVIEKGLASLAPTLKKQLGENTATIETADTTFDNTTREAIFNATSAIKFKLRFEETSGYYHPQIGQQMREKIAQNPDIFQDTDISAENINTVINALNTQFYNGKLYSTQMSEEKALSTNPVGNSVKNAVGNLLSGTFGITLPDTPEDQVPAPNKSDINLTSTKTDEELKAENQTARIEFAAETVEKALVSVGQEIKTKMGGLSNFIPVATLTSADKIFDNNSREALANSLSLLKMKAGIIPANGLYDAKIGEQLQDAILKDEELWKSFASETGTITEAKTNVEGFRLQLDILHNEKVLYENETAITHAKATKPGEQVGFASSTLDFIQAFPVLGQMINWLVHFFTGRTLEDLTGGAIQLGGPKEEQVIKPGDNLDDILPKLYDEALDGGNQEEIIAKIRDMAKIPIPGTGKLDEVANALEDTLAHIQKLPENTPDALRSEKFGEVLADHLRNIKDGVDLDLKADTLPTFTDEQIGRMIGGPQTQEVSVLSPSQFTEKLDQLYKLANKYNPSQTGANTLDANTALIVMGTNPESQEFLKEAGIPEGYMVATHGTQHYIFNPEELGMKDITEFKGLPNANNLSFAEYVWKDGGFQPQKIDTPDDKPYATMPAEKSEVIPENSYDTMPARNDRERPSSEHIQEYNTASSKIRIGKGELGVAFEGSVSGKPVIQVEIDFKTNAKTLTEPNIPIPANRDIEYDPNKPSPHEVGMGC